HGRGCRRGRRRRAFRPARRRIRTGCRTERQRRRCRSRPTAEEGGLRMSAPAHNPILVTALRWGAIFAAALAIVAGGVGLLVGGTPGLWGGLLGSVLAFAFLALTAGSMLLGRRLTTDDPNSPLFYGVVLAVWLVKLIVFFLFMYWLRDQPWLDAWVFFFTVIAAVLGSLIVDGFAFVRARTPYVDVALPGDEGEHS